jgi:transcriptional regulator with XRE-family HTH domain
MSQAEMGRATGVPPNTISRWETGIYKPSLSDLAMLAQFFGVPISRMLPEPKLTFHALDLMNAVDGLTKEDIQEVISYALFKRANAKRRH